MKTCLFVVAVLEYLGSWILGGPAQLEILLLYFGGLGLGLFTAWSIAWARFAGFRE